MTKRPVAAGKSSLDLVDQEILFAQLIAKTDAVYLDLACGAGRYSLALAERLDDAGVIYALDLWEEGIASLDRQEKKTGAASIKAVVADITQRLPLEDGGIDVCFIATALHDISAEKREAVITEVRRVLAPQGTLALIEFKKINQGPGPRAEHRIGEAEADGLVIPLGFSKENAVSLGESTYLVKYSKENP